MFFRCPNLTSLSSSGKNYNRLECNTTVKMYMKSAQQTAKHKSLFCLFGASRKIQIVASR